MKSVGLIPFIPVPNGEHLIESELQDYGDGNLVKEYRGATEKDYADYLSELESNGFVKFSDNGDGVGDTVFTSTYTNNNFSKTTVIYK